MCLMALGPMLFLREHLLPSAATNVRSDALSLVEDLYRGRCRSNFHEFVNHVVGDAVEVRVEGDVVIDIHPCAGPMTHIEAFGRQWAQSAFLDRSEPAGTRAFSLAERSMVQTLQQFSDRLI
jgi:hypothetical protein